MRTNLKVLRVKGNLSQQECAEKLGCCRSTYAAVESGQRSGTKKFWNAVQTLFQVPNDAMWEVMSNDKE